MGSKPTFRATFFPPRLFPASRLTDQGKEGPLYLNVTGTGSPDNVRVKCSVDTIKPNRALRKQQQNKNKLKLLKFQILLAELQKGFSTEYCCLKVKDAFELLENTLKWPLKE